MASCSMTREGLMMLLAVGTIAGCMPETKGRPHMPRIDGEWWTVARNPDLGELQGPAKEPCLSGAPLGAPQQPVDFSVWQAADGTWQLWSCIRNTNCGGYTRLLYGWEGLNLTDPDWEPKGIAMQADLNYETNVGGLQAPHVIRIDGMYHMFYGDWDYMMIQRSLDGKVFERWPYEDGRMGMFTQGEGCNTRDPMVIRIGDVWHMYYTAHCDMIGAVYCRTSKDLRAWSESTLVARGGLTGTGISSSECPHVVEIDGWYYLFRTQRYDPPAVTSVYRSKDPMDFGVDDRADEKFVCMLPVAAPEIVFHEGRQYIAALRSDVQGIQIARLAWVVDEVAERRMRR